MLKWFRRNQVAAGLSAGNTVTVAIQLCREKFGAYLLVSLLAHLWLLLGFIGLLVGLALLGTLTFLVTAAVPDDLRLLITLITVGSAALIGFICIYGRFMASGGLLARQFLTNLRGQTEDPQEAKVQVYSRTGGYILNLFWLLLLSLPLSVAIAGVSVSFFWFWVVWIGSISSSLPLASPRLQATQFSLAILVLLLFVLGLFLTITYLTTRLSFSDVILAMEAPVTAWGAVRRSWQLTRRGVWRGMTVFFVAGVIIQVLSSIAGLINAITFLPFAGLLLNLALFPLGQAVRAVLYYDLRCRNEGYHFDLDQAEPIPTRKLRRVCLQTPESIELDLTLAGIGSRTLGWIVDQFILFVGTAVLGLLLFYLYAFAIYPALLELFPGQGTQIDQWAQFFAILSYFVVTNGYYIIFETAWQGQTPGKRVATIRVVRDDGRPIALKEAALRGLLKTLDVFLFATGLFLILFSRSEKRLGDLAAGTLVIQDQQQSELTPVAPQLTPQGLEPMELSQLSQTTAEELLQQGNLAALSLDHYLTVRNFLQTRGQLPAATRQQTAAKLAGQLQELVVPDAKAFSQPGGREEELIEAIYLAYRRLRQGQSSAGGAHRKTPY